MKTLCDGRNGTAGRSDASLDCNAYCNASSNGALKIFVFGSEPNGTAICLISVGENEHLKPVFFRKRFKTCPHGRHKKYGEKSLYPSSFLPGCVYMED